LVVLDVEDQAVDDVRERLADGFFVAQPVVETRALVTRTGAD
jgi:hypothetical protein